MPCNQSSSNDEAAEYARNHWNSEARQIERHRSNQHDDDDRCADSPSQTDSINPDFGILIFGAHVGSSWSQPWLSIP